MANIDLCVFAARPFYSNLFYFKPVAMSPNHYLGVPKPMGRLNFAQSTKRWVPFKRFKATLVVMEFGAQYVSYKEIVGFGAEASAKSAFSFALCHHS